MLERLSIRWRLALISAALTFVILLGFALVIGQLTTQRIRSDFDNETANAATELGDRLDVQLTDAGPIFRGPNLPVYAAPNDAAIRVFDGGRREIAETPDTPDLGPPVAIGSSEVNGYRVETRFRFVPVGQSLTVPIWIEYARPLADLENTIGRVRTFLTLGVAGGTLLALLGGLALARRSLRPVAALTATARDIARTRDPGMHVPAPKSDDEVGELARTFDEMLAALEDSRVETEDSLRRQREFVADASHELRTPLTSVLANLKLLTDELDGERREAAEAALRSSRRMRRLVADLLLLARSDAGRREVRAPVDLAAVARDAIGEAGALSAGHELVLDRCEGATVEGSRDELHRVVLNLIENALHHTPTGTTVRVCVRPDGEEAVLTVQDDGPGVPEELRERIFERFVRSGGDSGSSTGLGLAIVRAVARAHGGDVTLEDAEPGARFVVRLPRIEEPAEVPAPDGAAGDGTAPGPPAGEAHAAPATSRRAALARSITARRPSRRGSA